MAEQFLNAVKGNFKMGLDGLASLDGFRSGGGAVGVERFLGGDFGGNRLPQFLMMGTRDIAEEQRTVDAGGTGVIENGLFVIAPTIAQPEGDLVVAGGRAVRRKLEAEFTRLVRDALLQGNRSERLSDAVAQQLGAFGIDALVVI